MNRFKAKTQTCSVFPLPPTLPLSWVNGKYAFAERRENSYMTKTWKVPSDTFLTLVNFMITGKLFILSDDGTS